MGPSVVGRLSSSLVGCQVQPRMEASSCCLAGHEVAGPYRAPGLAMAHWWADPGS